MSLYVLASGPLIGDPQCREGVKGPFTTATIRVNNRDEAVLVSVIAFGEEAGRLLELVKGGDAFALSGRARLTSWTGREGTEKHGISIVAEQIAAPKPRPRSIARSAAASGASRPRPKASGRSIYSAPRTLSHATELPADRVDDLYAEPIP